MQIEGPISEGYKKILPSSSSLQNFLILLTILYEGCEGSDGLGAVINLRFLHEGASVIDQWGKEGGQPWRKASADAFKLGKIVCFE